MWSIVSHKLHFLSFTAAVTSKDLCWFCLSWIKDMNLLSFGRASDHWTIPVPIDVPWLFSKVIVAECRRLVLNIPNFNRLISGSRRHAEINSWVELKARYFLSMALHFRIAFFNLRIYTFVWYDEHFQRSIGGACCDHVLMMWREVAILDWAWMCLDCVLHGSVIQLADKIGWLNH